MKKRNLVTLLSKAAMSSAMLLGLAGTLAPTATVFAAGGSGLLDSGSSASSTSGTSSSSSSSSSDSTSDSDSATDSSDNSNSDSDADTSDDDTSDASADTPSESSSDKSSYPSTPKSMPQTGLDDNAVKAASVAGIVATGAITAGAVAYKKNHKEDYQMRN